MNKININIRSEVETLQKVLVHTPGLEMNLLNSQNTSEFNFDFEKKTFCENQNFLLWDDTIYLEGAIREHREMCQVINSLAGAKVCIQFKELFEEYHRPWTEKEIVANLLFTRDLAFSFGSTTVVSWNSKIARNKENILTSSLFKNHPSLNGNKIVIPIISAMNAEAAHKASNPTIILDNIRTTFHNLFFWPFFSNY